MVRVGSIDQAAIAALAEDPDVLRSIDETVATPMAERMAAAAPKLSGAGAETIHSEPLPDGTPGFGVGWSPDAFYLGFAELGTEHQPARPFARPVADEFN